MSENLNSTMNGTLPSRCYNPTAEKISKTVTSCLIFIVVLTGNTVFVIMIIVYETKTMRKPTNVLTVFTAISDLLFPIFLIPQGIQMFYIEPWLIGGPLGQVLIM